jgi:DNA-binding MarR family transcriptional regulator
MRSTLTPKPEHIDGVLKALKGQDLQTPQEIARRSGLSLTAVTGALGQLERTGEVRIVRQSTTPKLRAGLAQ